jgi:hypothetical protein
MNHKATVNFITLNGWILSGLGILLLPVIGIQNLLVLAPVHNCGKRFKL